MMVESFHRQAAFAVGEGNQWMTEGGIKDFVTQHITADWQHQAEEGRAFITERFQLQRGAQQEAAGQLQSRADEFLEQAKFVGTAKLGHLQSVIRDATDRWNGESVRIAGQWQSRADQLAADGMDLVSQRAAEFRSFNEVQMGVWERGVVHAMDTLQGQTEGLVNHARETGTELLSGYGQAGRSMMDQQVSPAIAQFQAQSTQLLVDAREVSLAKSEDILRIGQARFGQLENDIVRAVADLSSRTNELLAQGKGYSVERATELDQLTRERLEELHRESMQASSGLKVQMDQFLEASEERTKTFMESREANRALLTELELHLKRFAVEGTDFALSKAGEAQQLGETKLVQGGHTVSQLASTIQTAAKQIFAMGTKFGSSVGNALAVALHNSMAQLNIANADELKDATVFVNEQIQAGVGNALSAADDAFSTLNSAAKETLLPRASALDDPMSTESVFLKRILETMVD
jgi:hypothetical protein